MATSKNALRARVAALQAQLQACQGAGQPRESIMIRDLQRRIGSANFANWQMTRWCFYDYVRLTAAGVSQLDFFANPLGSVDPVSSLAKTHEQTNMTKVRSFGQVFFLIQQIRTHIHLLPKGRQHATIVAAATTLNQSMKAAWDKILNMMGMGVLQITIGQKQYFDIPTPFKYCPPGFGPDVHEHGCVGTATESETWFAQQSNDLADVYSVQPAQMVEPEQTLDVKITFDNANTPVFTNLVEGVSPSIDVGVIFDGYIVRPSQ